MSQFRFDRRAVLKGAGAAAVGMSGIVQAAAPRRRYVNVGVGSRSRMYLTAITKTFAQGNELVGICDTNAGRLDTALNFIKPNLAGAGVKAPKKYLAADFDKMIKETKPDCVIVTCPDGFHHDYIVRSLDAGCDVLTEKPLATTPEKAQQIVDACKRNSKHLRVLFNYRYSPPRTQVKDLLMNGAIGDIMSVDFHWLLNTLHGADYFRRWHSNKDISGGLMIHKATHHFDLVNWWLGARPVRVGQWAGAGVRSGAVGAVGRVRRSRRSPRRIAVRPSVAHAVSTSAGTRAPAPSKKDTDFRSDAPAPGGSS